MAQATKTRILQSVLLLVWLSMVLLEATVPVQSQGCFPPLVTPGYMNPITITHGSWRPAIGNVTVKIDVNFATFTPEAIFLIEEGQRKWNTSLTCAGVNFTNFQEVIFSPQDLLNDAPFAKVHWEVDDPGSNFNGVTLAHIGFGGRVEGATIKIRPDLAWSSSSNPVYFNYLGSHEIGHTFNLKDCLANTTPACATSGLTIMGGHTNTVFDTQGPTACDFAAVRKIYCPAPSPVPSPSVAPTPCTPSIKLDGGTTDSCECNPNDPNCVSPVLIDVSGNGFNLTDAAGGVDFDMRANGSMVRVAWTTANSDDAWLAFDLNGNDVIDNGQELFGNFTPQPIPPAGQERNGFLALAVYDKPNNGGDGDGLITSSDTVFGWLRLWQDFNHNGISEAAELFSLQAIGLKTIELDYKLSRKTDEYGNSFRYRAKVQDQHGAQISRWAWDVFLVNR